jgi:hypothetical protein
MQQLNALLLSDAEARREFADVLNVDSALAAMAAGWALDQIEAPVIRKTVWRTASPRWITVAAACVAFSVGIWSWQNSQRAFATVEKAAGVVEMTDGSALRGEPHEIQSRFRVARHRAWRTHRHRGAGGVLLSSPHSDCT